ncbi:hypothetical protein [Methylobacterium sp. Leaf108]|uniref:hypothetical protein n=1 Tax=Methylobacterium sp. Leaf108 TaxID=1736256 RepID=UPI0007015563|nr:hypothetical protein [Methylobacterium sp. Leaf108]KQP61581.1 hypothetical protein ASF39_02600 [Methylobacterium sp. Leaf108]
MIRRLCLAAAVLTLAAPAYASPCGDAIASLESQVKNQAGAAISASTSGKAAAGAREGQGREGEAGSAPMAAPPAVSASAGEGGDRAMQARVALDEARTADAKADTGACEAAVGRARGHLAAAPRPANP